MIAGHRGVRLRFEFMAPTVHVDLLVAEQEGLAAAVVAFVPHAQHFDVEAPGARVILGNDRHVVNAQQLHALLP